MLMLASADVIRGACLPSYDAATGMHHGSRGLGSKNSDVAPPNRESTTEQSSRQLAIPSQPAIKPCAVGVAALQGGVMRHKVLTGSLVSF